jgi:hypothetical protein
MLLFKYLDPCVATGEDAFALFPAQRWQNGRNGRSNQWNAHEMALICEATQSKELGGSYEMRH